MVMVEHEEGKLGDHVALGHGADYVTGTGKIYIGDKQVATMGRQTRAVFERLLHSPCAVDLFSLAEFGGLIEGDASYREHHVLDWNDEDRIRKSIKRIREALKKVFPDLASKLQTEEGIGYRWANPDGSS